MKNIIIIFCFSILGHQLNAQSSNLYHPEANASKELEDAVAKAKKEGKYVLIQAGGNWCKWCIEFHRFCNADIQLDSLIKRNFVWYHLNYSKENKNEAIFKQYRFPQRFGFPVFVILDQNGNLIHTQNSAYLEDGKSSYDKEKVIEFLSSWSPDVFEKYMREAR
jgi:thioredoxin-related protein